MVASPRLDLRKARVLVVDDNAQSLELMTQILMGFQVKNIVACRSAEDAHEAASAGPFDLIILDTEMPGEDGLSLVRRLRQQPDQPNFTAPVILVGSHTPRQLIAEARDAGASLVVRKPIAPAVLLDRIVWLARTPRPFIASASYCGPDRRFRRGPPPETGERRAEAIALTSTPERAMNQDDIDALFG